MLAVNEMQVLNEAGFATPVVCVIIADKKAQVALSAVAISSVMSLWHMCVGFPRATVFIV